MPCTTYREHRALVKERAATRTRARKEAEQTTQTSRVRRRSARNSRKGGKRPNPPAFVWLVGMPASGKSHLQQDLYTFLQARQQAKSVEFKYKALTCKFTHFEQDRVLLVGHESSLGCEHWSRPHYAAYAVFLGLALREYKASWLVMDLVSKPSLKQATHLMNVAPVVGVGWNVSGPTRKARFIARHKAVAGSTGAAADARYRKSTKKWKSSVRDLNRWLRPLHELDTNNAQNLARLLGLR